MTSESLVSIGIAAGALIVSFIALYAQFFRRRARLVGLLVDKPYQRTPNWFQYALVNTGDVQILLREVTCDTTTFTYLTHSADVPCVISPGEIKLVKLEFKAKDGDDPAGVHFAGVTARGEPFVGSHSVAGSGTTLPGSGGPPWDVFSVVG